MPLLVSMLSPPPPTASPRGHPSSSSHVQAVALMYQYRAGEFAKQERYRASQLLNSPDGITPRRALVSKLGASGGSVMAQVQQHVRLQDALQLRQLREALREARCLPPPPPQGGAAAASAAQPGPVAAMLLPNQASQASRQAAMT